MTEINENIKNDESASKVEEKSSATSSSKPNTSKSDNRKPNRKSFKKKQKKDASDTPDMFERVIKINRVRKFVKVVSVLVFVQLLLSEI